jgi:cytochrome c oxidase subunit II
MLVKALRKVPVTIMSAAVLIGCSAPPKEARVIKVEMKKYAVIPEEIRVSQGESIVLEVTTLDVQHGFDVPDLGVSESIQPKQIARFRLPTDKKGTFKVECGVMCGPRHDQMNGRVVVE